MMTGFGVRDGTGKGLRETRERESEIVETAAWFYIYVCVCAYARMVTRFAWRTIV